MRRVLCLALLGLAACQSAQGAAAVLGNPGPDARASITAALKAATGRDVLIDDTAFTRESTLYITYNERRSIANVPRMGRVMTAPLRFDLQLKRGRCVLLDIRNERTYPLDGVECRPVAR